MVRTGKPVFLQLAKDIVRDLKRGHAWIYTDALVALPKAPSGCVAILSNRRNEQIASGIYDPAHPIPFRVCKTNSPWTLDDGWLQQKLTEAWQFRQRFFSTANDGLPSTGFRWVAGEGDQTPGLVIDVYSKTAVIKLDGGAPTGFYRPPAIARWIVDQFGIEAVVLRSRERGQPGQVIAGDLPSDEIEFLENGMRFTADVVAGQKTGFFLDQRDNRLLMRRLSQDRRVLNLFSFNGGFSIATGLGGATSVTSVDIAPAAIEAADRHWRLNRLPADKHNAIVADVFAFLDQAIAGRQNWDLVICDPPSFSPSEQTKSAGLAAYAKLAHSAARVTGHEGLLALASCSSHIDHQEFFECNQEALGRARRRATLLTHLGLPIDHPTPLAMPELRYLKFMLYKLD